MIEKCAARNNAKGKIDNGEALWLKYVIRQMFIMRDWHEANLSTE